MNVDNNMFLLTNYNLLFMKCIGYSFISLSDTLLLQSNP